MSFDPITTAMSKGKIFNLNDYGIYMWEIMSSGQKITEMDCKALVNEVSEVLCGKRQLPILHDDQANMYLVPSGANYWQVTASTIGAVSSGSYVKADVVITHDSVALFVDTLS